MSSRLRRRDLITYAFLSQGIYGTDDRLAGLLPLFHPIVEALQGEIFDPRILADRVNEAYPWSINTDVAENLIPRFQAVGWLEQIVDHDGDVAYKYRKPDDTTIPQDALVATEEELHEIGDRFLDFAQTISPLFSFTTSRDDLEELLLRWLVEKRAFDRDMIVRAVQNHFLTPPNADLAQDEILEDDGVFSGEDTYLCARFVDSLCNDPTQIHLFDKLVRISAVALIAEVVLDTQSPAIKNLTFSRGRVFYDSPLLLDLFGCNGTNNYENARFINDNLLRFEAIPSAFSHSIDEAKENLRVMLKLPIPERYGPTAEAIKKGEVLEDYVKDVLRDFNRYMTQQHVQAVQVDLNLYPNEHHFFSSELREDLLAQVRWYRLTARERDVDSIAYVMRKRRGITSPDITKAKPILITKNPALASIAARFCMRANLIDGYDVGPAVHQRQIASIVWMVVGNEGRKELARRELIRRCADVVRCRPDIVLKTRDELRRVDLEKARQFEALVTRPRPTQLLMDLTLGARRVVTSENLDVIFQRLKESAAEEVQKRAEEDGKRQREKHRKERAKLQEEVEQERRGRAAASEGWRQEERRRQEAEARIADARRREEEMIDRWIATSGEYEGCINRWIDTAVYGILLATAVVAFLAAFMDIYPYFTTVIGAAASLIGVVVAIGEKTGKMPKIGSRKVFEKRIDFIRGRAQEVGREDLLAEVAVDHRALTIRREARGAIQEFERSRLGGVKAIGGAKAR
jgi:hypothetical protein